MTTQATVTPAEILVGSAVMKVGDYGASDAAMVDVGGTDGGVSVTHTKEVFKPTVDQCSGPVKIVPMGETMVVKTSLAQGTLANLALAMGYPASAVAEGTFSFGGGMSLPEKQIQFFGEAPNGKERKHTFWKCVSVGATESAYKKGGVMLVPVEFEVLSDPTKPAGQQFGTYVDVAADTIAPTVTTVSPLDDAANVAVGANIQVTFSKDMRAETITADTILLLDAITHASVPGAVSYDAANKRATFDPTADLSAGGEYAVVVTTGVKDLAGNKMAAPFTSNFTTAV